MNTDGTLWQNIIITSLISDNTVFNDLSGVCGIAVRKNQGVNSTENARIYMADWKLRKLFLMEAESSCSACHGGGAGYVYKEKTFASNVMLSGVESDYFGDVWVVDNANGKVYKYTWDFQYLDELSGLTYPTSVSSVRQHHLNMAITEQWTNTTGNRTFYHGANIRNLGISMGYTSAVFSFKLTNFNYLTVIVNQNGVNTTLVDNILYSSGNQSENWYKSNPLGTYSLQLTARSFDDPDNVYKFESQSFFFPLKPVTISGPGQLAYKQKGTYTANTSGGSADNISYQWYMKYKGNSEWSIMEGTESTQNITMATKSIYLKVEASSGDEFYDFTKFIEYSDLPPEEKTQVEAIPEVYSLKNNYPNPFNPLTTIKYDLPENSFVELFIFDLLGREVKSLIRGNTEAGFKSITWDSKDNSGKPLPSGVYLYLIKAKSLSSEKTFSSKKKMVLLK